MKKKNKNKHTFQVKIGDDKIYKPLTAEYLGCFAIIIPILIFLIIFIVHILEKYDFYLF